MLFPKSSFSGGGPDRPGANPCRFLALPVFVVYNLEKPDCCEKEPQGSRDRMRPSGGRECGTQIRGRILRKKIEQLLNGKFEYEQPRLLFSAEELSVTLKAGETRRGELYFGTENNERIRGYITSSSRRLVPGLGKFSGTTICLPYGVDGVGMKPGERIEGWLCFTTSIGEYKIPFVIRTEQVLVRTSWGAVNSPEDFLKIAREDFREAYRLFTDQSFPVILEQGTAREKALYAGLSRQPVTYQHLEEFFVGRGDKEPVLLSLPKEEKEFYNLRESVQEYFVIQRSGWGHLRLDVEARGEFLEIARRVITDEDFIGSSYRMAYVIRRDKLGKGNQFGEIVVRSPYQELKYSVMASTGSEIQVSVSGGEKKHRVSLVKDYLDYRMGDMDLKTWAGCSHYTLNQLREAGCTYPEYQLFEVFLLLHEEKKEQAAEMLKKYQKKMFSRDDLELAGVYLYLCAAAGLYKDWNQALNRIESFFDQKPDSFALVSVILLMDRTYTASPARAADLLEGLFERGCTSPLLYGEAWQCVTQDITLLRRLSRFWIQVFLFAAKRERLTEELMMRISYLSGYEKGFSPSLYRVLSMGYERFPSDDTLEAVCKYIMKGNPRRPEYFRWFSLAVERGLRITRLYEYYVETLDTSYQRELPRSLLMYFAYNDNTLGDTKKAFVYASVVGHKEQEPSIYENYKENMAEFAARKLAEGRMNEDYAVLYQEFLSDPETPGDAQAIGARLFTFRLYCDDPKIRQIIVRHNELAKEEIYPCVHGVGYPRIYTKDAVILFQDEKQRRYVSTVAYNLSPLMDERGILSRILEKGASDPGALLHYCENTVLCHENLDIFRRAAGCQAFSAEYRRSVEKRLLEYYGDNAHREDLDGDLKSLDYREFVQVDRKLLLETLISRGLFPQAMSLVEEFGCEGIDDSSLLKLISRMILRCDMAEDDELLALASEVYRKGKYDEVTLQYLMDYRFGPLDELYSVWNSARGFDMDVYALEERLLGLYMLTSDYGREGEEIFSSYMKQVGKERLMGAYMTMKAYGMLVKELPCDSFMKKNLLYAWEDDWTVNKICRIALLCVLARDRGLREAYGELTKTLLRECVEEQLVFSFFGRFPPELLSPYQLDDKTFVECHAHPGEEVTLFYALDAGLGTEPEFKSEPLKNMYEGIFTKTFTLFYGETLRYYFRITHEGSSRRTGERTISMNKVEGAPMSKYQLLNQMLSARKLGKDGEVTEKIREYLRREQYVKEMFVLDAEEENG